MSKVCKWCGSVEHYAYVCFKRPQKPIKVRRGIRKFGPKAMKYAEWRDTTAIPFLDEWYGHKCVDCGRTDNLDVDHVKNRGSHPELIMDLNNVMYRCRICHIKKTDHIL